MSRSYEELVARMLDKVPSDVDKREGSIIFDAIAPCAFFLADQVFKIDNFYDLVMPDTAPAEYLDRLVSAYGMERKEATNAVRLMTTSSAVDVGTRWGIDNLVYAVTGRISPTEYEATCEAAGVAGNQPFGLLSPVSNIYGVSATLGDVIVYGADRESDDALRTRFYTKVRIPATSGNAYHYEQWALEVAGVGAAKVFPLDNGPGTVTVLVLSSDLEIDGSLPAPVHDHIETVRPIGATVTVQAPQAFPVSVTATVHINSSTTIAAAKAAFTEALKEYLKSTAFKTYRLSYARLSAMLLDIDGVEDIGTFKLNGGMTSITVGDKQVPTVGTISITEAG